MKTLIGLLLSLFLLASAPGAESPAPADGEVRIPLPVYTRLLESDRPTPASAYAIGRSDIAVLIVERDERTSAEVNVTLTVEIFEDRWTLVPLLPLGVALSAASVDGVALPLVQSPQGLAWSTERAGTATLQLAYSVDARRSENGYTLPLPVPAAAASELTLTYPGTGLDIAIVPAVNQRSVEEGGLSKIHASLPGSSAVMITWRAPLKHAYALSRARYRGELSGDAVVWRGNYQVELFSGEQVKVPLLPASVNLIELSVDGQAATALAEDGYFTTFIQGRGLRQVEAVFQVPVLRLDGPPRIDLHVPRVPMSQFELTLPGDKEVKVAPSANVQSDKVGGQTVATVFMPMVEHLSFSWLDAVPEDLQTQVRANASLYHALYAEEGVLHGHAIISYEITRGETNLLELLAPADAQINRIQGDGVADWTVADDDGQKRVKVFLNRAVSGDYLLNVFYERLLGSQTAEPIPAPLLQALDVNRQRGMVALLAGQELTLRPATTAEISAVGENQLPAFVSNQIALSVAHTYKYTGIPTLTVTAVAPERQQGKFNAQVDTLISIGEVTLRGSATVEVNVKSGAIMTLQLRLANGVNILGVTGPALRSQQIQAAEQQQLIALEFNREMSGQFQIEVNYERIMADSAAQAEVPLVTVSDAEVEHGRIAVEALTAVEVQAQDTDQLSLLDINELPQQLVLKTTNPILLAYKYVHTEAPRLTLRMVRHQEIEVQLAAIEAAHYQTLITRDGLAVTTARFTVRNSRRQFLRLELPARSQVWSVFVDGQAEKPAHANDAENAVLIKLINSASGFPVEVVYATPTAEMQTFGQLSARLPRPDMVVTQTYWDVYLPVQYRYLEPTGNLDVVVHGRWVNPRQETAAQGTGGGSGNVAQPLRINVPTQGVHFRFEKLYANQAAEDAEFTTRYFARELGNASLALSGLGALLVWVGIFALWSGRFRLPNTVIGLCFVLGIALLLITIAYLETEPTFAAALTLFIAVVWLIVWLIQKLRGWRTRRAEALLNEV